MTVGKEQGKRGERAFRNAAALSAAHPEATKPRLSLHSKADSAGWHVPSHPTLFARLHGFLFSVEVILVMELQWPKPHFAS